MTDTASVRLELPELADTMRFGAALGSRLRPGDLVLLAGELGAGKTALTKGIAVGMGITETITSPTFVLARVHNGTRDGLPTTLVHVDAYRLGGSVELDDLDLDTDLSRAAVVIEWGEGIAAGLASDPLHIKLIRHPDDSRSAVVSAGARWRDTVSALVPDPA
ncbi:tRNA (adenosine(37)-N6)-threonylcarbamoyltransferase complex ATPase subunit type 1 TsaE [Nakamurella lactea]|uniref:tRNA (adenosine(37)-N6)-threonylcarbamoyltransferase complex ATPase subunit type 1 TsaE n=1 Tax=Nakamurella lactea TaxID=459515 RepID=UPI000405E784|nr:tRNA (adenosine(37)-N6)-threonylcarbamoyltransferase complex ATPase subunit type 1 TsaE [Nakamurella lactea]